MFYLHGCLLDGASQNFSVQSNYPFPLDAVCSNVSGHRQSVGAGQSIVHFGPD